MKSEKILVVEENPLVANAIEAEGERFSVTLDRATDGWQAIKMLETGEYAAIVIDSDLPLHSGFGVITYLREEVGNGRLHNVIVMTTSDEDTLRRKLSQEELKVVNRDRAVDALSSMLTSE